jgi:alkylation response protein AidB-like acyl-CoA dehydrogenase
MGAAQGALAVATGEQVVQKVPAAVGAGWHVLVLGTTSDTRHGETRASASSATSTGWPVCWGGNGILLENQVGRFVADSEAIYSYEGTREINTLIVGRAITGLSAFV